MKRLVVAAMACLLTAMTTSAGWAQPVNPCEGDIARFCSNLRPGKGVIAECLSQHEEELSPACKLVHLAELSKVLDKLQQICEADSTKFCGAELQQRDIRLIRCLKTNQAGLSPDCRTTLFEALDLMHY